MREYKRREFKPGEKFGKLTITKAWLEKYPGKREQYEYRCECDCDCGQTTIAWARSLVQGLKLIENGQKSHRGKRSCGCLTTAKRPNNKHWGWKGHGEISGTAWTHIQRHYERRKHIKSFEITIEQAWDLFLTQQRKCAISGIELTFSKRDKGRYGAKDNTASLDRIDSSKGYTSDNIQWVHKVVNVMKLNLPQDEFVSWCKVIAENNCV